MTGPAWGWRAYLADEWVRDAKRLLIGNRQPDGAMDLVVGFDADGNARLQTVDPLAALPFPGLLLPADAVTALADVLRPEPVATMAEVARLTEALAVERARVDQVLDRTVRR